ncbi:MAG: DUF192 domain-containing protein [Natronospirillum sp.]
MLVLNRLTTMRVPLALLVGLVLIFHSAAVAQELPIQEFKLGEHTLTVEIVSTEAQRARGLMERESMAEYAGMLFVYPDHDHRCFWMQNTLIPLTLAFLSDDGLILQLVDMEPLSTQVHCSRAPVRYALELNQGWFDRNDVALGDQLQSF